MKKKVLKIGFSDLEWTGDCLPSFSIYMSPRTIWGSEGGGQFGKPRRAKSPPMSQGGVDTFGGGR